MGTSSRDHTKSIGPAVDTRRMRVLLVEDEEPLARYVAAGLRKHGFAVDTAHDGRGAPARPPVLRAADVTLDPARRTAERAGRLLPLAPKEFGVLALLMTNPGDVVSAETLLDKVWDEHADPFTNAVRITVGTLRR